MEHTLSISSVSNWPLGFSPLRYCPTMSTKPLLTWWNFSCITSMCLPEACRGDRTLTGVSSGPTKTNDTAFSLWCRTRMLSILKVAKKRNGLHGWSLRHYYCCFGSIFQRINTAHNPAQLKSHQVRVRLLHTSLCSLSVNFCNTPAVSFWKWLLRGSPTGCTVPTGKYSEPNG